MIIKTGIEIDVRADEANPESNVVLEIVDPDEHGPWFLIAMPVDDARQLGKELLEVHVSDGVIL